MYFLSPQYLAEMPRSHVAVPRVWASPTFLTTSARREASGRGES